MNRRILVIDDTKNIRLMLSKCLSGVGYIVDTADSGEEGIEYFKKNRYDIVLLDIRMPKMSGTEVLKKIREINDDTLVIIITAFPTVKNAVDCIKLGAVDYIRKPFTPDKIRNMVKELLERKKMSGNNGGSFELTMQYAKKCINERNFDKGEEYLKKAISISIENPEPFILLGNISELKEDYDNARKYYKIALELEPESYSAAESLNRIKDRL